MNTFFKSVAALLAISLPVTFVAESLGIDLPTAFNTAHAFGAFVIAVTVLTLAADYTPARATR